LGGQAIGRNPTAGTDAMTSARSIPRIGWTGTVQGQRPRWEPRRCPRYGPQGPGRRHARGPSGQAPPVEGPRPRRGAWSARRRSGGLSIRPRRSGAGRATATRRWSPSAA